MEKAWLQYLEPNKEFQKAATGRGQCTSIRAKPKAKTKKNENNLDTVRSNDAYMAIAQIKQSRRCGQLVERLKKMTKLNKTSDLYIRNAQLNKDAIKGICKHLDTNDDFDENMQTTMEHHTSKEASTMMIPTLMLHMKRCQDRYEHYRAKASLNKAEIQKTRYKHKTKGAWRMSKKLIAGGSPPLTAVARLEKGPQGHAVGTIATSPKEVDAIVRKAYEKIYEGNCSDQ